MARTAEVKEVGVSMNEERLGAPAVILEAREELQPIFIDPTQA